MSGFDDLAPCGGNQLAPVEPETDVARLQAELSFLREELQRSECMMSIQRDAVQLALDLLVTHPDLRGFFRMFIKRLVDDSGAHACGVWLLDEPASACELWMANIGGETLTAESPGWAALDLPREGMARHLGACDECRAASVEYRGDDARLPAPVRAFNRAAGVRTLLVAPLLLPPKTLGWIALSSAADSECERGWLAGPARRHRAAGDARPLLQPARRAEPVRGPAAGRARGAQPDRPRHPRHAGAGLRRHPDAAAGGAARRLESPAEGGAEPGDRGGPRAHAPRRGPPVGGGAAPPLRRARGRARGAAAAWSTWRSARTTCRSTSSSTSCRRSTRASSARSSASRRRR